MTLARTCLLLFGMLRLATEKPRFTIVSSVIAQAHTASYVPGVAVIQTSPGSRPALVPLARRLNSADHSLGRYPPGSRPTLSGP